MKEAMTSFHSFLLSVLSTANIYCFLVGRKVTLKCVGRKFIDILMFTSIRRLFFFFLAKWCKALKISSIKRPISMTILLRELEPNQW